MLRLPLSFMSKGDYYHKDDDGKYWITRKHKVLLPDEMIGDLEDQLKVLEQHEYRKKFDALTDPAIIKEIQTIVTEKQKVKDKLSKIRRLVANDSLRQMEIHRQKVFDKIQDLKDLEDAKSEEKLEAYEAIQAEQKLYLAKKNEVSQYTYIIGQILQTINREEGHEEEITEDEYSAAYKSSRAHTRSKVQATALPKTSGTSKTMKKKGFIISQRKTAEKVLGPIYMAQSPMFSEIAAFGKYVKIPVSGDPPFSEKKLMDYLMLVYHYQDKTGSVITFKTLHEDEGVPSAKFGVLRQHAKTAMNDYYEKQKLENHELQTKYQELLDSGYIVGTD